MCNRYIYLCVLVYVDVDDTRASPAAADAVVAGLTNGERVSEQQLRPLHCNHRPPAFVFPLSLSLSLFSRSIYLSIFLSLSLIPSPLIDEVHGWRQE